MGKIIDTVKKIKYIPYYYVGPCPNCGSFLTGRYFKHRTTADTEWAVDEALKNGELIRPIPDLVGPNCFCLECEKDFDYPIEFKLISYAEQQEEKTKRHTAEYLMARYDDDYHKKRGGPLGIFTNFVGKI